MADPPLPPMPVLPITSASTLRKCKAFPVDPDHGRDIFIASYPKSGTTWTQCILHQLLTRGRDESLAHISDVAPFFEINRTWAQEAAGDAPVLAAHYQAKQAALGRRVFNTHLRWDMMPGTTDAAASTCSPRYLYLVRDPRDVVVSYYHHLHSMSLDDGGFEGSFEAFFTQWLAGSIAFGGWMDHLVSWAGGAAAQDPRVLILHYEAMKADLPGCLTRIAAHCGIPMEDGDLPRVAARCSFAYMSEHRARYEPRSVVWRDLAFRFMRKGEVGDHQMHFTDVQHQQFAAALHSRFGKPLPPYIAAALVGGEASLKTGS